MALIRATSGSGGSGGQSKSGTFTVAASSWSSDIDCGFVPSKVYIGFTVGTNAAAGYCVYDEEQSVYKYVYRSSTYVTPTFANYFTILSSSPKGFKMKNDFGSYPLTCYYLAVE